MITRDSPFTTHRCFYLRRRSLATHGVTFRSSPRSWRSVAAAVWLSGTVAWGTSASALDCPKPHPFASASAIKESPDDIAGLSSTLSNPSRSSVTYAIANLRHKHPHAKNGEIMNYLVTAYCPVVNADAGKSDRQKRTELFRFNRQVMKLVYK